MADPQPFSANIPGLAKLIAQIAAIMENGADLRSLQTTNAPQASNFDQPVGGLAAGSFYTIPEAQSGAKQFYQLVITFDAASGSGRYRMDGAQPTPTIGIGIPAGGVVLTITGANNIKNFQMTPEAGQTLTFARYLFI